MNSRIILIDDDCLSNFINRKILTRVLPGVEIKEFTRGKKALNYFKTVSPSDESEFVVFLDINMPEMSGWDVLETFDQEFPELPAKIVMLTSSIDQLDRRRAAAYERVVSYITKPIDSLKITRLLRQLAGEIALAL